jgi:aspartate carbamoyltransferase catalytic subunit
MTWARPHLLGIDSLDKDEILTLLDAAEEHFRAQNKGDTGAARRERLRGRTVLLAFFEPSTRTRASFEVAAKRLGADIINVGTSGSSVVKGETLLDTARNLRAMSTDLIVVRHVASGAPHFLAQHTSAHVVNAGDGTHEHPTQALLDAFTMRHHKKKLEGLVVTIVGDIAHSRVARSNAILLGTLGAEVRFFAPRTLLPRDAEALGPTVRVCRSWIEALGGADVVMTLRIQKERLAGAYFPSTREYARHFGLNAERLAIAKPDAIVMHPGPMNRGVEIDSATADGVRSVILEQVEAGVAVRSAVLEKVLAA